MKPLIEIHNASLNFRSYSNPTPALKELVIETILRRKRMRQVEVFRALKNISLTISEGERVGIIGLNGAGKSTLLRMIAGIYAPHEGKVAVRDRVTPLLEMGTGFDIEISGRDNIYLNGALLGFPPKIMRAKEKAILEFAELENFEHMPLKYYSSGSDHDSVFPQGNKVIAAGLGKPLRQAISRSWLAQPDGIGKPACPGKIASMRIRDFDQRGK